MEGIFINRTYRSAKKFIYNLDVKLEGKRLLGRARQSWDDNITIDVEEIGCESVDWVCLVQNRERWRNPVNTVITFLVPQNAQQLR
jgi:hypothetical protein